MIENKDWFEARLNQVINWEERVQMQVGKTAYILKQLEEYKADLESKGYNVVYIGLYGSQNYNLDDRYSDIDARAVVLPTIRQLLNKGKVSKVYQYDTGEVDVKDVLTFMVNLAKGNPAYIETTTSNYILGEHQFNELCRGYKINPRAVLGMMHEKKAAIEKGLPKSSPMLEKIGYDPKQLHHILRLHDMTQGKYIYESSMEREEMIDVKRSGGKWLKKEHALNMANLCIDVFNWENGWEMTPIKDEVYEYIERKIFEDMLIRNAEKD